MEDVKRINMLELAKYQAGLWKNPQLRFLFFELTDCCNLGCRHCGSNCSSGNSTFLETEQVFEVLSRVAEEYDPAKIMICLTGGDPMLHARVFEVIKKAHQHGFSVGMTSNGTLIDYEAARKLVANGLDTISISIDGIGDVHDSFRGSPGCYDKALAGIEALKRAGIEPQAMTVVHKGNLDQLEDLYKLFIDMDLYSWRLTNVDPIGRAAIDQSLLLNHAEYTEMLDFIRSKRFDPDNEMEVTYGCAHFLTYEYERTVRDAYFQCGAGTQVASIMANGNIGACLDIVKRPDLVQGNIYEDDFVDVWEHRYGVFRKNRAERSSVCRECEYKEVCIGDSAHTWDYERDEPMYCYAKGLYETESKEKPLVYIR